MKLIALTQFTSVHVGTVLAGEQVPECSKEFEKHLIENKLAAQKAAAPDKKPQPKKPAKKAK
ncbi:hypothetical protein [Neptunicella sp.]|uniref:hypothetical protein n=1 Tax=Neptunicella sp. TaxID=2125986 RepID=UPI003F69349E